MQFANLARDTSNVNNHCYNLYSRQCYCVTCVRFRRTIRNEFFVTHGKKSILTAIQSRFRFPNVAKRSNVLQNELNGRNCLLVRAQRNRLVSAAASSPSSLCIRRVFIKHGKYCYIINHTAKTTPSLSLSLHCSNRCTL